MKKIFLGIKRSTKRFLLAIIFALSILWTFLEPIFEFIDFDTKPKGCCYLIAYLLISLFIACYVIYPKRKVKFSLTNTNTKVEIVFGDLFKMPGHKVISATEFFDSKIGKPVSPNSLHGVFLNKILGGHTKIFDDSVNSQLLGKEIEIIQRVDGKTLKYEIGSTIIIDYDKSRYFIFALSTTDNECNANSTPILMLNALDGLWNKIRIEGNGNEINLPLIGNGLSRIGLPPSQLLQLILISLLKSSKERDLCSTIRIVLTDDIFEKIDLEIIKNNWQ